MIPKTDQDSNTSVSTNKNSNESIKKLRVYYSTEKYLDIPLHKCDTNDIYFVKCTKSYKDLKEIQSDECFKFINNFEDSEYMFFLQQKAFQSLFESENDFPENILKKCFEKKAGLDSPVRIDISNTSFNLDHSTSTITESNQENKARTKQEKIKLNKYSDEYETKLQYPDENLDKKETQDTMTEPEIKLGIDTTVNQKNLGKASQQILLTDGENSQNISGLTPISDIYKLNDAQKQVVIQQYTAVFMQTHNAKVQFRLWIIQNAQIVVLYQSNGYNGEQIYQKWTLQHVQNLISSRLQQYEYNLQSIATNFKEHIMQAGIDKWLQISKEEQDEYWMNWAKAFHANLNEIINRQLFEKNFGEDNNEGGNMGEQSYGQGLFDISAQYNNVNTNNIMGDHINELGTYQQRLHQSEIINQILTPGGEIYEGDLKNNKRNGKGKQTLTSGDIYEGHFVNGKKQDKGKLTFANGDTYKGDFVKDKFEGKGKHIVKNCFIYEGDFLDDKYQGKGKYTNAKGSIYEGDFVNGQKHGKGKYTNSKGSIYEGDFVNGQKYGKGKFAYQNGDTYEGDYKQDKCDGKGKFAYQNGDTY